MTPITPLKHFLEAAAATKAGMTEMFRAISEIEALTLDWAEASGSLGEYNTPPVLEPVETPAPAAVPEPVVPAPAAAPEPAVAEPAAPVVPEPAAPEFTFEEVRSRLVALAKQGHADAVKNILTNLGVDKLSDIPPNHYPEIMALADGINQ